MTAYQKMACQGEQKKPQLIDMFTKQEPNCTCPKIYSKQKSYYLLQRTQTRYNTFSSTLKWHF